MSRRLRSALGVFCIVALCGCDVAKFTADSTAGLFARAAPAFESYWDYDLAGEAVPATIVQLEGILRIVPDNDSILAQLSQAYMGYAYGWVEADVEALEFEEEYDEADVQRQRIRTMYLRAMDLTRDRIRLRDEGVDYAVKGTVEELDAWLHEAFQEKRDAEVLLWHGYAWGSYINAAKDDMEAVADLAYAKAFVERSIELDPDYYHAAGYTFMGVATASEMAADLDTAKLYFEKALDRTERRALLTQVNMARYYAVKTGNRELFDTLLAEVMEAQDPLPEARLSNRMARERAAMYLKNADQLF
ncbi:MAG: TRAP transporter TatT component family protein [Myxococcales bacterium]|nr:TRAP transporter TatT component family protein [Myxococcales bacterium]